MTDSMSRKEQEQLRAIRRDLHRHPEAGWLTYRTTALAAQWMEEAGFEIYVGEETVPWENVTDAPCEKEMETARQQCRKDLPEELYEKWIPRMGRIGGLVAIYDSGRPGGTAAYRFDMDALRVREDETDRKRNAVCENFTSCYKGYSHACGHDGHTAMGLMLAHILMKNKDQITGRLLFIFQTAEEGVRGAKSMCRSWRFGKIDTLLCCHIGFTDAGVLTAGAGGFLATSKMDVFFEGRSAHAGLCPQRGRNALLAAAESAVSMQNIPEPESGTVRLNVGILQGGEARNTIPAHAFFKMETRGSDDEKNQYMKKEAQARIQACAKKYGVQVRIEEKGASDSAFSDEKLSRLVLDTAKQTGAFREYRLHEMFGASDDGAVFMEMVQNQGGQAAYLLLGTEQTGHHHESIFDYDEKVLSAGVSVLSDVAFRLLDRGNRI